MSIVTCPSIANHNLLRKKNQLLVPRAVQKPSASTSSTEQLPIQPGDNSHHSWRSISGGLNLPSTISNLLHLSAAPQAIPLALDHDQTPTLSPKDDISSLRHAIHGPADWSALLDPLHPSLRREIMKYGEFAQATYDAFDNNPVSEYHGSSLYCRSRLISTLGLSHHGYNITKYVYATSHLDLPRWLLRPLLSSNSRWCDQSAWMGFVAVSGDAESRRIGFRDIAVAWRGTVSPSEWLEDAQAKLELLPCAGVDGARVERGFLSLYTSRSQSSHFTQSSASEQVMRELLRLVEFYKQKGEEVSVTITGHSLGGALALLNAAEAASLLPADVGITVISFGAPRVGNQVFGEMLKEKGVKVLRLVTKQDVVPKVPGVVFNEWMKRKGWEWVYTHVGDELVLDAGASPYLKRGVVDIAGFHGLETYLHLVDGYERADQGGFRVGARRDFALVNKASALLREELRIPANWYQPENKGMVRNEFGRWVLPRRDPEDIPSPCAAEMLESFISSSSCTAHRVVFEA